MTNSEIKEVATGIKNALSREPLALGILLFVVILFGINAYFENKRFEQRVNFYKPIIEKCVERIQ